MEANVLKLILTRKVVSFLLADRTNGRAYAMLRPSSLVCRCL